MKMQALDETFDDGEAIVDRLDLTTVRRAEGTAQRVNRHLSTPMLVDAIKA
jgi:hypothetical protein